MSWQEKFTRLFGPGLHTGTDLRRYFHQLKDNRFRIHPRYATRLMAGLQNSAYTSIASRIEQRRFGEEWSRTNVAAPLFILGHWRSGTTHLHNLLATDNRFATPNLYQVMYPRIFLTTEERNTKLLSRFLPKTRFGLDNMPLRWSVPYEDEFAIAAEGLSMFLSWSWPKRHHFYDRFMKMSDVSNAEMQQWENAWMTFLRKLTLKYQRPLILKSPPHTARIKLILKLFPDAKFVHVHRHPYDVFRSRQLLDDVAMRGWPMQAWKSIDWNQRIIDLYSQMHTALLEQRSLVSTGSYCEVRYDDLERDPFQVVKSIYQSLALPFDDVSEDLHEYVKSIAQYRKNNHPKLPETWKRTIDREWERFFCEWSYDHG